MPIWRREQSRATCDGNDVDAASLRAYQAAGEPALAGRNSTGGERLSLCTKRLGGRCKDRIYRTHHADTLMTPMQGSSSIQPQPVSYDSDVG